MKTVSMVAKIANISRRTLHYYDEIGLLVPHATSSSGYRLYSNRDLERLQQIMFFKEMGFSLNEIKEILTRPHLDHKQILKHQKHVLNLKKKRLEGLIDLIDKRLKGDTEMSFKEFNTDRIEQSLQKYEQEARQKWGDTAAYNQSRDRTSKYTSSDWNRIYSEAEDIYSWLAEKITEPAHSREVQDLISQWRQHITKYYYDCTLEIFSRLGQAYKTDIRFKNNIDQHKEGLAEFMSRAIEIYVKSHKA